MWTYIWMLVGFKTVTTALILYYTHAFATVAIILALHLPWIVGAVALLGLPSAFWYRLMRARSKRTELLRQEFQVDPLDQTARVSA